MRENISKAGRMHTASAYLVQLICEEIFGESVNGENMVVKKNLSIVKIICVKKPIYRGLEYIKWWFSTISTIQSIIFSR